MGKKQNQERFEFLTNMMDPFDPIIEVKIKAIIDDEAFKFAHLEMKNKEFLNYKEIDRKTFKKLFKNE